MRRAGWWFALTLAGILDGLVGALRLWRTDEYRRRVLALRDRTVR